ncbi:MAG: sulfatase-like hydrolase/transferase [Planctomycetes bacterium]|nr:sulfatase-like hydrolase/transferase [Planctomycetota bacterium]
MNRPVRVPPRTPAPAPQSTDLNFVIVLLDDGGAEWFDWSALVEPASGFVPHPRLSELRQLGVAFRRAYATPICAPSRARLWSGSYGFDLGLGGNPAASRDFAFCGGGAPLATWQSPAPITARLLPRLLQLGRDGAEDLPLAEQTYAQASFGKSHLHSDVGRETWPIDHGLGFYAGCQPNAGVLPAGAPNAGHYHFREVRQAAGSAPVALTRGAAGAWPAGGPYVAYAPELQPAAGWGAVHVLRDALTWMNASTKPFLALVNFNPPHSPFEVPPFEAPDDLGHGATGGTFPLVSADTAARMAELAGRADASGWSPPAFLPAGDATAVRAVFRANLEAVDALIGKLWDRLEPGRRARTVFLVLGDNGTVANCVDAPYDPLRAKRSPYELGARVPCVAWGPPDVIGAPGRTCDHLLHVVDVLPTILELAGCEEASWKARGGRVVRGRSFAAVLRDPGAPPARDHVYNEIFLPLGGTRDGPLSIDPATWTRAYSDGTHQLIVRPQTSELYRVDAAPGPASGLPGYLQRPEDDLFPRVGQPGEEPITELHAALRAALEALLAS